MIKRFKNFDANEYLEKKNALREAAEVASTVEDTDQTMEIPEDDPDDIPEDEVIFGTPVYKDPYLLKISHIFISREIHISQLKYTKRLFILRKTLFILFILVPHSVATSS